jgi:hypothetical protein
VSCEVLVLSGSAHLAEDAVRHGLRNPEQAIEQAICQGRKRARPPEGVQVELGVHERFVIVDRNIGAIVRKAGKTGQGRARFFAVRLIRLQPRTVGGIR